MGASILATMLVLTCLALFGLASAQVEDFSCFERGRGQVVFEWSDGLVINWPNESFARPHQGKEMAPIGIKVYKERVFLTVPRWSPDDVPINMAVVKRPELGKCIEEPTQAALDPYPSWEMNRVGDCSAFQYVQSMSFESDGTAWLADNGRQFGNKPSPCKPKLVLMDLNTDKVLHTYTFPEDVVSSTEDFLNDIVLDVSDADDKFAFISESNRGSIIVYSRKQDRAWRARHSSMFAFNLLSQTTFLLDPPVHIDVKDNNVNGIAITSAKSGSKKVFYSPLTSYKIFEVDTATLRDEDVATKPGEFDGSVRKFADKPSKTDGLIIDEDNVLYSTDIERNGIYAWNVSAGASSRERLFQDNVTCIWPDTVAIDDDEGFLWFTTRGYPIDSLSRVLRVFIGSKSGSHIVL